MSINFCHIAPTNYLHLVKDNPVHLLLAHLVEEDMEYRNFYANLKRENPNVFYHLDNSAFERFKQGKEMYPANKLIEMAKLVNADSIVMSDYPKEFAGKTIDSAKKMIGPIKDAGFKTFFVPQSEFNEHNDLIESFAWAIENPDIDYIGVSILACPIAFGVDEQTYQGGKRDEAYRMQRFLARWMLFNSLDNIRMLGEKTINRFHCLGMTDGPNEIDILRPFHDHIWSWDSSSAIWHGINEIEYDHSPTGLKKGKYEEEVDFQIPYKGENSAISYNMFKIKMMCKSRK